MNIIKTANIHHRDWIAGVLILFIWLLAMLLPFFNNETLNGLLAIFWELSA